MNVDSLASVVQGAVAFDSPDDSLQADQGQKFQLYENLSSAKRGTEVKVTLPSMPNLKVNETPVFFQNMQVGVLSNLELSVPLDSNNAQTKAENPQDKGVMKGTLLIDPNHIDLLRQGSKILLKEPKFNLNKEQISKINELFRGIYLILKRVKASLNLNLKCRRKRIIYFLARIYWR
ncbi:Uncharacterised protein [Actinobacillus equuli]|nr:Uncharacterised protein [Actinobacillus equuli]